MCFNTTINNFQVMHLMNEYKGGMSIYMYYASMYVCMYVYMCVYVCVCARVCVCSRCTCMCVYYKCKVSVKCTLI